MKRRFNQLCCGGVLIAMLLASSGCHTVKGAGEDVQSAGQHIEHAAD